METLELRPKHKIKTVIDSLGELKFGTYFLFQQYAQAGYADGQYSYEVSRPILGVYVAALPCDQTVEIIYLPWFNEARTYRGDAWKYPETASHIEWSDYADVLGIWQHKPTWREILAAYRKQRPAEVVKSDALHWGE